MEYIMLMFMSLGANLIKKKYEAQSKCFKKYQKIVKL